MNCLWALTVAKSELLLVRCPRHQDFAFCPGAVPSTYRGDGVGSRGLARNSRPSVRRTGRVIVTNTGKTPAKKFEVDVVEDIYPNETEVPPAAR
jgi:hypothetical protein